MADLVILCDGDKLSRKFSDFCRAAGKTVMEVSIAELAKSCSIRRDQGRTEILPVCPIFVRVSFLQPVLKSFDENFAHREAYAVVWAFLYLQSAVVINRPSLQAPQGSLCSSPYLNEATFQLPTREESYVCFADNQSGRYVNRENWGLCVRSGEVMNMTRKGAQEGTFYVRPGIKNPGYVTIIVVGSQFWVVGVEAPQVCEIGLKSIQASQALKLVFCEITWLTSADFRIQHIVSINPQPTSKNVSFFWTQIAKALCEALFR